MSITNAVLHKGFKMKARYWLYVVAVLVLVGYLGKFSYESYKKSKDQIAIETNEVARMQAVAKKFSDRKRNAKKASVIILPYCVNYSGLDLNKLTDFPLNSEVKRCVFNLLKAKDYDTLDQMISYLRDNMIRSPSGLWVQSTFYKGAQQYIDAAGNEKSLDIVEKEIEQWIARSHSPDAAKLVLSDVMMEQAWRQRGSGMASSVSPENFAKFYVQIEKTKKYLLANEDISARDPKWFSQMLKVLAFEQNASVLNHKKYFDQAVATYPNYSAIYYSASIFYYSKWHGMPATFDQFAKYAIKNLPKNEGSIVYAQLYWNMVYDDPANSYGSEWMEHWREVSEGLNQLKTDYPDQVNFNAYGWMACAAGDKKRMLEIMADMKNDIVFEIWQEPFTYRYCSSMSGKNY